MLASAWKFYGRHTTLQSLQGIAGHIQNSWLWFGPSSSYENTYSYKVCLAGAAKADVTAVECLAPWRAHQSGAAACVRFYEKQRPNDTSAFKHCPQTNRSPYPRARLTQCQGI